MNTEILNLIKNRRNTKRFTDKNISKADIVIISINFEIILKYGKAIIWSPIPLLKIVTEKYFTNWIYFLDLNNLHCLNIMYYTCYSYDTTNKQTGVKNEENE